jgi:hypothetical protein
MIQETPTPQKKPFELGAKYIVMGKSIKKNRDYVIKNLTI